MSETTNERANENKESAKTPKKGGLLGKNAPVTPKADAAASFATMTALPPKKVVTPEMKKSSITVTGSTRIMLNALVMLDKAETIDDLVANIVGEYVDSELTADEKAQYDMFVQSLRAKLKK